MSNKLLQKFPLGRIYTTGEGIIRGPHGLPTKEKIKETKKEIRHSLRARIILLFAAMAVILSTAAIMVNFFLYSDTLKQQEIMGCGFQIRVVVQTNLARPNAQHAEQDPQHQQRHVEKEAMK